MFIHRKRNNIMYSYFHKNFYFCSYDVYVCIFRTQSSEWLPALPAVYGDINRESYIVLGASEVLRLIPGTVKLDAVSLTARHCYDISRTSSRVGC